MYIYQNTV